MNLLWFSDASGVQHAAKGHLGLPGPGGMAWMPSRLWAHSAVTSPPAWGQVPWAPLHGAWGLWLPRRRTGRGGVLPRRGVSGEAGAWALGGGAAGAWLGLEERGPPWGSGRGRLLRRGGAAPRLGTFFKGNINILPITSAF